MEQNYTFERLWEELNNGYQIYYNYLGNRYLLSKVTQNCYSQELISSPNLKSPHPKLAMLTLKRVKEIFPYMESIEYNMGISEAE